MAMLAGLSDVEAAALVGGGKKVFLSPDDSTKNPNDYDVHTGNSVNSKQLESGVVIGQGQLKKGDHRLI